METFDVFGTFVSSPFRDKSTKFNNKDKILSRTFWKAFRGKSKELTKKL